MWSLNGRGACPALYLYAPPGGRRWFASTMVGPAYGRCGTAEPPLRITLYRRDDHVGNHLADVRDLRAGQGSIGGCHSHQVQVRHDKDILAAVARSKVGDVPAFGRHPPVEAILCLLGIAACRLCRCRGAHVRGWDDRGAVPDTAIEVEHAELG